MLKRIKLITSALESDDDEWSSYHEDDNVGKVASMKKKIWITFSRSMRIQRVAPIHDMTRVVTLLLVYEIVELWGCLVLGVLGGLWLLEDGVSQFRQTTCLVTSLWGSSG